MDPATIAMIVGGASSVLGSLFSSKKSSGAQYPAQYLQMLEMYKNYIANNKSISPYTGNTNVEMSGLTSDVLGWAQQFGAEGMNQFMNPLAKIAQGSNVDLTKSFDELANYNADKMSTQVRQKAGAMGVGGGTGVARSIADIVKSTKLEAATQSAQFKLAQQGQQIEAAKAAMSLGPNMLNVLAQIGMIPSQIQEGNITRAMGNYYTARSLTNQMYAGIQGMASPLPYGSPSVLGTTLGTAGGQLQNIAMMYTLMNQKGG